MLRHLAYAYNHYSHHTHYGTPTSDGSPNAVSTAILIAIGLLLLALVVLSIIGLWKMFVKAGRPGWAAIIPIYNSWVIFEMAGKPGWWALVGLLYIIPIVGFIGAIVALVLSVIAMLELAKRFGKSPVFAIFGLVLFSGIGFIILGFGKAEYEVERTFSVNGVEAPELAATKPRSAKRPKKDRS